MATRPRRRASTFTYGYYVNTWGLIKGLEAVKGDISGPEQAAGRAGEGGAAGAVRRRSSSTTNRQAIFTVYDQQLYMKDGKLAVKTVSQHPERRPDVRRHVQRARRRLRAATPRGCEKRDLPWLGKATPVKVVGG